MLKLNEKGFGIIEFLAIIGGLHLLGIIIVASIRMVSMNDKLNLKEYKSVHTVFYEQRNQEITHAHFKNF